MIALRLALLIIAADVALNAAVATFLLRRFFAEQSRREMHAAMHREMEVSP